MLFRPLPFPDAGSPRDDLAAIARLFDGWSCRRRISATGSRPPRRSSGSGSTGRCGANLIGAGEPERIAGATVSAGSVSRRWACRRRSGASSPTAKTREQAAPTGHPQRPALAQRVRRRPGHPRPQGHPRRTAALGHRRDAAGLQLSRAARSSSGCRSCSPPTTTRIATTTSSTRSPGSSRARRWTARAPRWTCWRRRAAGSTRKRTRTPARR